MVRWGVIALGAMVVSGCVAVEESEQAEIDPRQGEAVDRVCFIRNIDNWRSLDRRSVLVERGINDWYKLDLIGVCDPDAAFNSIALRSRGGSSCLRRGDTVFTDEFGGDVRRCSVRAIYRWDMDAGEASDADGESEEESESDAGADGV